MRAATLFAVGCLAPLSLAGCDAGNKESVNRASGPSLFITSPKMDQVLTVEPKKDGAGKAVEPKVWPVQVMLDLRDYVVGEAKKNADGSYVSGTGQHVHVILDDDPYMAIYDASKPVALDVRSEGTHVVRAFPSAGPADSKGKKWHEAWKNPGAFAWVKFHVNTKGGPLSEFDGSKPLLTYSRPKGEYKTGDADAKLVFPLMVDFYLNNVTLESRGNRVRMTLDGGTPEIYTEWKPHFIPGEPAAGEHTVVLELIDRDEHVIEGPFSRTERKIKVVPAK